MRIPSMAPALIAALLFAPGAIALEDQAQTPVPAAFVVHPSQIADQKAVFGKVQSLRVTPARSRLSGTVAELAVSEGDQVKAGQVIAVITDGKLALRISSVNARMTALAAQKKNADTELARARDLYARGIIPKSRHDKAVTAANVVSSQFKSARADRNVLSRQVSEGKVLAPSSGTVLEVPATTGQVVLPGEVLARIAEENFILRLALPERHARFMHKGDVIRVDASLVNGHASHTGTIIKVYPKISAGRVLADAKVEGLGNYFVGERVRAWVSTAKRSRILVPAHFVTTRFGVDYVRLLDHGKARDVVVQRGIEARVEENGKQVRGLEILAGLGDGDKLVAP